MKKTTVETALTFLTKNISDPVLIRHTQKRFGQQKVIVRAITQEDKRICEELRSIDGVKLTKYILEDSGAGLYHYKFIYKEEK